MVCLIQQIMVSCFAKTSRFEEYLSVKVVLFAISTVISQVNRIYLFCLYSVCIHLNYILT